MKDALPSSKGAERNFFTWISIAMAVAVFIGFARTFYLKSFFPDSAGMIPPEPFFRIHGALFTAWMVLLVSQALLIRVRKIAIHRRLGMLGVSLAAAMYVTGIWGALIAANRPGGFLGIPVPPDQFLIVPVIDLSLFALFVAWAVAKRSAPQTHKRLMLFATINLIGAAIARWPFEVIGDYAPVSNSLVQFAFVVAIFFWDFRSEGRIRGITLTAFAITLVFGVGRFLFLASPAWLAVAHWLMGLAS